MTLSEQIDKFANETRDTVDIICRIAKRQGKEEVLDIIEDIKAEIAEYKDDKVIHAERNEMIDIVLGIIDKHISGKENKNATEKS